MVSKLVLQTLTSEFESYWMPHSYGLLPPLLITVDVVNVIIVNFTVQNLVSLKKSLENSGSTYKAWQKFKLFTTELSPIGKKYSLPSIYINYCNFS